MRTAGRLRLRSLAALLFLAPFAHAQSPIAPQGQSPTAGQRPSVQPVKPASYSQPKQATAPGQLPADILKPPLSVIPKVEPKLTKFDPLAAEVRREGRNWQLWSGQTKLREFGENRNAAYEARRLVADLRLTEHGAIGTPEPVMEYWLAAGHAPPVPGFSRNIIPFEPKGLRVVDDNGVYFVGDGRRRLFNFGPHEDDARQAMEVIRRYDFNEVGFIGSPTPSMTYMLKNDSSARRHFNTMGLTNDQDVLPQLAPRHPLDLPGLGRVGERRPFDPMRIEVRRSSDGWHLVTGPHDFGSAGPTEYQARSAMQIAQRYPLTEFVRLGKGDFSFYLSNGQAPRGAPLGVRRTPFQPKALVAKQTKATWEVSDGRQTLGTFAAEDEAKVAIKVIQHYGFNCLCEAGALHYLAQDH